MVGLALSSDESVHGRLAWGMLAVDAVLLGMMLGMMWFCIMLVNGSCWQSSSSLTKERGRTELRLVNAWVMAVGAALLLP